MGNRFTVKQDWNVLGTTFRKNTQFTIIMGVVYMDGMILSSDWQKKLKEAINHDLSTGGKYIWEDKSDF